jgi:hypothetical protein
MTTNAKLRCPTTRVSAALFAAGHGGRLKKETGWPPSAAQLGPAQRVQNARFAAENSRDGSGWTGGDAGD